jgi:hypothetical protein
MFEKKKRQFSQSPSGPSAKAKEEKSFRYYILESEY